MYFQGDGVSEFDKPQQSATPKLLSKVSMVHNINWNIFTQPATSLLKDQMRANIWCDYGES